MPFQSQNLTTDDWEDDYSMVDDDESISSYHSGQEDPLSSARSECAEETEGPVEEDTSGPTSGTCVRPADNELLPAQNSSLNLPNRWHTPAFQNATSHVEKLEDLDGEGLVPVLDGFAKAFKEAKEASVSDQECSLDPEADHFVGISEFQSLQSQVNNNSLSLKNLENNTVLPRIAELEGTVRNHAERISRETSETEILGLRKKLESLTWNLQLETRRGKAMSIALDEMELGINKIDNEQSYRISSIEQKMKTLQPLQRDTEDNGDEPSRCFPAIDQKMGILVDLVREIKLMNSEQTERLSNIEWTNCALDGDLQSFRKSFDQVEAVYTRLNSDKEIENWKTDLEKSIEKRFSEDTRRRDNIETLEKDMQHLQSKLDWSTQSLTRKVDTELSYIRSLVENKNRTLETSYGERLNQLENAMTQLQREPQETYLETIYGSQITDLMDRLSTCEQTIEQLKNYQLEAIRYCKPAIDEQDSLTQQVKDIKLWQETIEKDWMQEQTRAYAETSSKLETIADEVREILKSWKRQIRDDLNSNKAEIQNSITQLALEQENCSNLVTKCSNGQQQFSQKMEKSIQHVWKLAENTKEYSSAIIDAMDAEREEQFQERMNHLKKEVRDECDQTKEQCHAVLTVCQDAVKQMTAMCDVISGWR